MKDKPIVTYEPDNSLKFGYFAIIVIILREIKDNRWLIYQFFKRDFFAIYKQSFMGLMWALIIPLFSVGTFILLNQAGIFEIGTINVPYPVFAILSMSLWQMFAAGLVASSNSLVLAGGMITKINLSRKSLVIAAIGQSLISFLIQFILLVALFFYYGFSPSKFLLYLPLFIIPIIFLTMGLGFILSLLNGIMRDIGNFLNIFMTFLMFLTPILYVKPASGILKSITEANPLYYLISYPRDLILTGIAYEGMEYFYSSIFSLIVFIIFIIVFHLTETRITERV